VGSQDRIADLEAQLRLLSEQHRPSRSALPRMDAALPVRWARTCKDPDSGVYPAASGGPNCYWFKLLDGTFDTSADGYHAITWTPRQTTAAAVLCNITGAYLAEDSIVPVWFVRGRWWANYWPGNITGKAASDIPPLSGSTPGSGTLTLWDGGSTGAWSATSKTQLVLNFSAQVATAGKFLTAIPVGKTYQIIFESCGS